MTIFKHKSIKLDIQLSTQQIDRIYVSFNLPELLASSEAAETLITELIFL